MLVMLVVTKLFTVTLWQHCWNNYVWWQDRKKKKIPQSSFAAFKTEIEFVRSKHDETPGEFTGIKQNKCYWHKPRWTCDNRE